MTTTDLAAALIAGVPRYEQTGRGMNPDRNGAYFAVDDVLAALTSALDPAIADRAGEVLEAAAKAQEWMRYPDDAESISLTGLAEWVNRRPASVIPALVSVAQSLLAQNAALRAERDEALMDAGYLRTQNAAIRAYWKQEEANAKAAEAVAEKLRGALQIARVHVANNAEGWSVSRGAARDDLTIVDAALTTEADNGAN